jgi:hypothetical protein
MELDGSFFSFLQVNINLAGDSSGSFTEAKDPREGRDIDLYGLLELVHPLRIQHQ